MLAGDILRSVFFFFSFFFFSLGALSGRGLIRISVERVLEAMGAETLG
jgi:hypothetical protein